MLKPPNADHVKESYQKTLALKIMSLDLNTTENVKFNSK